ncbi:aminotransferase-like domain-containing protein [Myroides sp. LJL119]
MNSPVRFSFKNFVELDKQSSTALYLQITDAIIHGIQRGLLICNQRLPGSRVLSNDLQVHRNTITKAYNELQDQGWIEIKNKSGAFVIPYTKRQGIKPVIKNVKKQVFSNQTAFAFKESNLLRDPFEYTNCPIVFNDGTPDVALTHIQELISLYSANMKRKSNQKKMGYYHHNNAEYLKMQLCNYLNLTRALHIRKSNLLISRSLEMSLYIFCQVVLQQNDIVVVGKLSYFAANMIFQKAGATIKTVDLKDGVLSLDSLEKLCQLYPVRMVYTMPEGHYPTTGVMEAKERERLLELSKKYGFIILEDASDYDFKYDAGKDLSIATKDTRGSVVYLGSFGKSLAPGFRASFIVAPDNLILELQKYLCLLDRHGNVLMELALGEMIEEGSAIKHLNKSIIIYKKRRDNFDILLNTHLKQYFNWSIPSNGLAFWLVANKPINLLLLSNLCHKQGLFIPKHVLYQDRSLTALRLGFGHLDTQTMQRSVLILKDVLHNNPNLFL